MPPTEGLRIRLSIIFLCLILIVGCSSLGQIQTREIRPYTTESLATGNGWWYARYRMTWPPDTEPIWYMDLYLAHQIIMPLLLEHQNEILLWRFHRRAARDGAGRQFSFIFYASPQTAQSIFQSLQSNPLVDSMKFAGVIDEVIYDDPAGITRPNIEDSSDGNWPVSIQKTWPYFIMGASQMWLNLIVQVADDQLKNNTPTSVQEIETFYRHVDETVTDLWQNKGRHAFMHHLNALFEFKPLIYWEKRHMTF